MGTAQRGSTCAQCGDRCSPHQAHTSLHVGHFSRWPVRSGAHNLPSTKASGMVSGHAGAVQNDRPTLRWEAPSRRWRPSRWVLRRGRRLCCNRDTQRSLAASSLDCGFAAKLRFPVRWDFSNNTAQKRRRSHMLTTWAIGGITTRVWHRHRGRSVEGSRRCGWCGAHRPNPMRCWQRVAYLPKPCQRQQS